MKALGIFRELIATRRKYVTDSFLGPAFRVQKLHVVDHTEKPDRLLGPLCWSQAPSVDRQVRVTSQCRATKRRQLLGRWYQHDVIRRYHSKTLSKQESRAVARKPRDAAAVLFGLKFANDIHYKFKSSQASKARLQSSKRNGTKQNLTQNSDSRSFKVTCFGVSGKATKD